MPLIKEYFQIQTELNGFNRYNFNVVVAILSEW